MQSSLTTQRYAVSHIDLQQALVIVEHASGQFNLYLSDITGVYFSLSLPDIVSEDSSFDLELVSSFHTMVLAVVAMTCKSHVLD